MDVASITLTRRGHVTVLRRDKPTVRAASASLLSAVPAVPPSPGNSSA
jgi:hypothetical protein